MYYFLFENRNRIIEVVILMISFTICLLGGVLYFQSLKK